MGLDYSFELVAELPSAERLIRAVAEHLVPDDRERVIDALQRAAPGESANIGLTELDRSLFGKDGKAQCFCFQFEPDDHLLKYSEDSPVRVRVDDGLIPVGCVWTGFQRGTRFILINAMAATTGMSRLFKDSESIRKTFRDIGQRGGAIVVFFNDEEAGEFIGVWPSQHQVSLTEPETAQADSKNTFDVDQSCTALISAAADAGFKPPQGRS